MTVKVMFSVEVGSTVRLASAALRQYLPFIMTSSKEKLVTFLLAEVPFRVVGREAPQMEMFLNFQLSK